MQPSGPRRLQVAAGLGSEHLANALVRGLSRSNSKESEQTENTVTIWRNMEKQYDRIKVGIKVTGHDEGTRK